MGKKKKDDNWFNISVFQGEGKKSKNYTPKDLGWE